MALVEVEESDLRTLREAHELLSKLDKNDKTRKSLLKLVKEIDPSRKFVELEAEEAAQQIASSAKSELDARSAALEGELKSLKAERQAEKSARDMEAARGNLRAQGWDDDGIKKIEELMVARGIPDYDAAAALVEKQLAPNKPADRYLGKSWGLTQPDDGDTDHELLMKNPDAFKRKMVNQTMAELRGGIGHRTQIGSGLGPQWGGQ